jgi:hypothetical protein
VRLVNPSLDRSLTIDGRGGDDIISASSDAVDLTLVGGSPPATSRSRSGGSRSSTPCSAAARPTA